MPSLRELGSTPALSKKRAGPILFSEVASSMTLGARLGSAPRASSSLRMRGSAAAGQSICFGPDRLGLAYPTLYNSSLETVSYHIPHTRNVSVNRDAHARYLMCRTGYGDYLFGGRTTACEGHSTRGALRIDVTSWLLSRQRKP